LGYTKAVIEIRETAAFSAWLRALRDAQARARIAARIRRLAFGNLGDVRPVGEGVSELRIHYGPGYRVYFVRRGDLLIIVLCGGDKTTQPRDIESAKRLAKETA
jgi:putative addiction module killer protein